MFISVVLNVEYMDVKSRSKWYLKNLLHCKDNGGILITHQYLKDHIHEFQKDITPDLFTAWEMRPFSIDELENVEQYTIPDDLFNKIEKESVGRTELLSRLHSTRISELDDCLNYIFDLIKNKHRDDRIEGVFHCLAAYKSLSEICHERGIPLIPYSFSAFRKTGGYRETQYYAALEGELYCQDECERHYRSFMSDTRRGELPVFSNRELIAIFGKDRTLPLIPLMDHAPQYELGACCECFSVLPHFYLHYRTTDDDIFYQAERLYDKCQIKVRSHSIQLDQIQVDRTTQRNDPAPFLLSCRRHAAVRSQIILKALLWKRTGIMMNNTLDFSFACEKDYLSTSLADVRFLNYYLIGSTIPSGLMFSFDYWRWRLTNPSEVEIYKYHLDYYCEDLCLDKSIIDIKEEPERFKQLLISRNCDEELIPLLVDNKQDFEVEYDAATSKFIIGGQAHWRLNKKNEAGDLKCEINLKELLASDFEFYPLDDMAGFSRIMSVKVNGEELSLSDNQKEWHYLPKVKGRYVLPINIGQCDRLRIEITWQFKKVIDYLNNN